MTSRALGRLLIASVREHDWNEPGRDAIAIAIARSASLDTLPTLAAFHGVTGCVWHSLRGSGLDPSALAALEESTNVALGRHLAALGDLAGLGRTLDAAQVPWLVFKGPVLSETLYSRPDLRAYRDLDVLVPPARFGDAVRVLEGSGAEVRDQNWRLLRGEMRGQVHLWLPYGTPADLHWHLVNRDRGMLTVPVEQLFERSRPVLLNGVAARTLDPADTLVHLALHAGLEGAHRLVWLKDVERAVASGGFTWDEVIDRARAWGCEKLVAFVLGRARRVLGANVPAGVLAGLSGPVRRSMFGAADRAWRPARTRRGAVEVLVGSAAARGARWTATAVGRRTTRWARRRPKESPAAVLRVEGDVSDRVAFIDAVAGSRVGGKRPD
jgi:hypothetical protein